MDNCCVDTLEEMHEAADAWWWLQKFIAASPFILLLPALTPTPSSGVLLARGLKISGTMAVKKATLVVNQNKKLPDFVDAVQALGKFCTDDMRRRAQAHGTSHRSSMKEWGTANYWENLARVYDDAFFGR